MRERDAILRAWRGLEEANRSAVLATVVHVTGSAYRRPGARMLVLPDGRRIGSISGGCLEGDVSKKAWWFTEDGRPSVRVYDTTSDEDAVWEFGLGCNGVIEVMLERVETDSAREALKFLDSRTQSRKPAVMGVVIRTVSGAGVLIGERLFADEHGLLGGKLRQKWSELKPHVEQTLLEKRSRLVRLHGYETFVEYVGVAPELVIFGAGHDAVPVASLAAQLGWHVTVADGRPAYATPARFPEADRIVVMQPGRLLSEIEITRESLVVMMTHNYTQDKELLAQILPARPRYLGMLGPAKRAENIFRELGISRSSVDVHTPVGLDIGADFPEAIALSIVAEIQAELAGRNGMKLRHRRGPIHAPALEAGVQNRLFVGQTDFAACEVAAGEIR